jgi:hypothetical protein
MMYQTKGCFTTLKPVTVLATFHNPKETTAVKQKNRDSFTSLMFLKILKISEKSTKIKLVYIIKFQQKLAQSMPVVSILAPKQITLLEVQDKLSVDRSCVSATVQQNDMWQSRKQNVSHSPSPSKRGQQAVIQFLDTEGSPCMAVLACQTQP